MQLNRKSNIILAEDEENHIFIIKKAFAAIENFDCELHVAYDGEELICFFNDPAFPLPDLILLDIKLPKKDGFELIREIRRNPRFNLVPIVVFTSSARIQDMQRCYQLGANSYIVKPMNFEKFKEIVFYIQKYWLTINNLSVHSALSSN